MNYALIENGAVTNLIWLYPGNASEFANAVRIDEGRPVSVGDTYANGKFCRDGVEVLTEEERIIAELDEAVVALEYQNILYELGV